MWLAFLELAVAAEDAPLPVLEHKGDRSSDTDGIWRLDERSIHRFWPFLRLEDGLLTMDGCAFPEEELAKSSRAESSWLFVGMWS